MINIHGKIIGLTSAEVAAESGAAVTLPVEITLQKAPQGKWLISAFRQVQQSYQFT